MPYGPSARQAAHIHELVPEQGNRRNHKESRKQAHVPLEGREIVAACHMAVGGVTILEVQSLFSPAEHLPLHVHMGAERSLASIPVYLLASL